MTMMATIMIMIYDSELTQYYDYTIAIAIVSSN